MPRKGPITYPKASQPFRQSVLDFIKLHGGQDWPRKIPVRDLERKDSGDYELVITSDMATKELKTERGDYDAAKHLLLEKSLNAALALAKSLFKADTPFRTRVSLVGQVATDSSGGLNFQKAVNSLASVQEWGSLDVLFDECFVHSMTMHFMPYNRWFSQLPGGSCAATAVVATTASTAVTSSLGMIIICLFGVPAYFTSNAGMLNSPSRRLVHSSSGFKYAWRNHVRFDPHGETLSPPSGYGWTGWTQVSNVGTIGGAIQMRALNDNPFGSASAVLNLGSYVMDFDVSFRVRL